MKIEIRIKKAACGGFSAKAFAEDGAEMTTSSFWAEDASGAVEMAKYVAAKKVASVFGAKTAEAVTFVSKVVRAETVA